MTTTRGTSNTNARGSSYQRRALTQWMLNTFGDGETAQCAFDGCPTILTAQTMTKDRYPIPGRRGGRYVHGNVRPACMTHNASHGAREAAEERATEKAKRAQRNARRRENRLTKTANA